MRFFTAKRNFRIMRHRKVCAFVSASLVLVCALSLAFRQLNLSVDFTGGVLVEISLSQAQPTSSIREAIEGAGLPEPSIQLTGDGAVLLRMPTSTADSSDRALEAVRQIDPDAVLLRAETVGSQVGDELFANGVAALLVVCAGIMVYLSMRFKWRMAAGAIVANLHDVVFILGAFSLFGWEFGIPVLAAVLAALGYSVNESVIIFDRMRENLRNSRANTSMPDIIDKSITQTWSRTIITHGSTQLAVLAMLLFGGPALFYFALTLTIGIFASIYSSILIAGPVALFLGLNRKDFVIASKRAGDGAVV